jgi:phage terminase small subunit
MTKDKTKKEVGKAEKPEQSKLQMLKKVLTIKELHFVEHYVAGNTPVAAFEASGLDTNGLSVQRAAEVLLRAPKVKLYIDALHSTVAERSVLHLEALDQKLADIVMTDMLDCVEVGAQYTDDKGVLRTPVSIRDPSELTAAQRAAIVSMKSIDGGLEIKAADKLKAIEMLIKRRGGFTENTNLNITGDNVKVIAMPGDNGRGPKAGG